MMIRCGNHCFRRKPSSLDTQDSESITNTKRGKKKKLYYEKKNRLIPNDYGD